MYANIYGPTGFHLKTVLMDTDRLIRFLPRIAGL